MKKNLYLILCILGTILPYTQFIPFVQEHGLNLSLFFQQLFANRVSGMFAFDIFVSSAVLWVFIYSEGARLKMRHLWVCVVCNLLVGVSLGLPLFLLMRESKLSASTGREASV